MEHLEFVFPGGSRKCRGGRWTLAGVVASGNLEVLIEPDPEPTCRVSVETSADGYADIWRDVLEQGVMRHDIGAVRISIHDGGATPAVVGLRLDQAIIDALEMSR